MTNDSPGQSREFWFVSALFIMGLGIRLYHIGALSLGDDELTTNVRISHPFFDTIFLLKASSFPPLYYAVLNLWVRLSGHSEWALRLPSAVFSSSTVIVIYKLAKELFNSRAGLIASSLLVFSPFSIHYAQFAKMYSLFWLLEALSFLFFFRYLKDQGKTSYRLYVFASTSCCYTMYTGFLFLAAQAVIFLLTGPRAGRKQLFGAQLTVLGLCLPWILAFLCSRHEVWGLMRPTAAFDYVNFFFRAFFFIIGSGLEIWTSENWAVYSSQLGLWQINCFLYVFSIIFLAIDVLVSSYRDKKAGLALPVDYYGVFLWAVIPLLIYFIFDYTCVHINLEARYVGFLQVPIILLISGQLSNGHRLVKKAVLVAMLFIAVENIHLYFRDSLRFPQQDWRTTAQELTRAVGPNDIIVSFVYLPDFQYYYKADTRRFFMISEQECTTEFLIKRGILKPQVHAIFLLYKNQVPEIQLNGFSLGHKVSNGANGFLYFKRHEKDP